ncbi:hypothetical protein HYT24_00795 [Candidatus Pacearchaeota archaeon]|nr:hypothetical protein [Candidatus Pacearchaeota archaeon]
MVEYGVRYQTARIILGEKASSPSDESYNELGVDMNDIDSASARAAHHIDILDKRMVGREVWEATVEGNNERRIILKDGEWLIDKKTGKVKQGLEKMAENQ